MDAGPNHITKSVPVILSRRHAASASATHAGCDSPGSGQQKMPGTAGRVDHRNSEERLSSIVRLCFDPVKYGVERTV
jgi:hypothetical protein